MSKYLSRSDFAFETFLLADPKLSEHDKHCLHVLFKHHPKTAARIVAVSKTKGRSNTEGRFYLQQIRLPCKCQHEFAAITDGDELFHGKKFIEYPDGTIFLQLELLCESRDNYCPEELMLEPSMLCTMAANNSNNTSEFARELPVEVDGGAIRKPAKRYRGIFDRTDDVEVDETYDTQSTSGTSYTMGQQQHSDFQCP